jgi:hypothetical protein
MKEQTGATTRSPGTTKRIDMMPQIDEATIVAKWIDATNTHDAEKYLSFFTKDAVLDDPSVGEIFEGASGISRYFQSYFVEYNTQTRLVRTERLKRTLHVEVDFTGDFPGGQTEGIFDITFSDDKISRIKADLL